MNVIFLDFNGVLDTYENFDIIDEINLSILINVINLTNSQVVITSSNKNTFYYTGKHNKIMEYLIQTLQKNNVKVLGITKQLNTREEEIKEFLLSHQEITHYCILEDDYIFETMKEHQIKLTSQKDGGNGLKESSTDEIVNILTR